jgi:hypothetical protein
MKYAIEMGSGAMIYDKGAIYVILQVGAIFFVDRIVNY